jgi:AcrR family transcriptional regulator
MTRPRVLVGGFSMEANTFAPGETTLDDLRAQVFGVGADVHRDFMGPASELAGAWTVLEQAGYEPVPSVAMWAGPGRPLAAGVVDELVRLLVAPLDDSIAGAYAMLHGACVAHDDDDPEGRVLEELRRRLGPGRPLVASLDCHANVTQRMVDHADAFTAYRTCPHVDTRRTGEQAGRIIANTLAGRAKPVTAVASRPMITPPDLHDSSRDPFRRLMALNDEVERDGALASCLLPVQPWVDLPGLSWKAVVTADGDADRAAAVAEELIEAAWRCLARTSYRNLSVDDVCVEAGLSKGAFYTYFPHKQDLLVALLEHDAAGLGAVLADAAEQPSGLEQIRRFVAELVDRGSDAAAVQLRADLWAEIASDESIRRHSLEAMRQRRGRLARLISDAVDAGEIVDVPANALAAVLLALGDGLMLHRVLDPSGFRWENVRRAVNAVLEGLRPEASR